MSLLQYLYIFFILIVAPSAFSATASRPKIQPSSPRERNFSMGNCIPTIRERLKVFPPLSDPKPLGVLVPLPSTKAQKAAVKKANDLRVEWNDIETCYVRSLDKTMHPRRESPVISFGYSHASLVAIPAAAPSEADDPDSVPFAKAVSGVSSPYRRPGDSAGPAAPSAPGAGTAHSAASANRIRIDYPIWPFPPCISRIPIPRIVAAVARDVVFESDEDDDEDSPRASAVIDKSTVPATNFTGGESEVSQGPAVPYNPFDSWDPADTIIFTQDNPFDLF